MISLRRCSVSLVLCAVVVETACGKKGPPLAPLQPIPARADDLTVRRLGDDVYLRITVPQSNQDGARPADLTTLEVYGFTDDPKLQPQPNRVLRRDDLVIARIPVRPPPEPEAAAEDDEQASRPATRPPPPEDPRPPQGSVTTYHEKLTEAHQKPIVRTPEPGEQRRPVDEEAPSRIVPPVVGPRLPEAPLVRYYFVLGVSKGGRRSLFPQRRGVPLGPAPPAPLNPAVKNTEQHVEVRWDEPPGAPRRVIQAPPEKGILRARRHFREPPLFTYNVYDATVDPPADMPSPLNDAPLDTTTYEDAQAPLDSERCYVVRTVYVQSGMPVESEPSPRVCLTRTDTFPPSAPQGLTAVGAEGAINLIWEPAEEPDLAGYLVLRAEAGDETLQPVTPSAIIETTYRDTEVQPGVRYVYAVLAVDKAGNRSEPSVKVEEVAR